MSTNGKDQRSLDDRLHGEMLDSIDEELEMELDDKRLERPESEIFVIPFSISATSSFIGYSRLLVRSSHGSNAFVHFVVTFTTV